MRWVVLTDDWPPQRGGVATWALGAASGLARAGCAVQVYARSRPELTQPAGVEVIGVRGRSFGRTGPWWTGLRAARALLEADAVLATTWPMARAVAPVLRKAGVPLHVVFHGSALTRPEVARGLEGVVAGVHCWAVSRFLVGLAGERGVQARWIASPVGLDGAGKTSFSSENGKPTRLTWTMVCRATELKGIDRFVRLVAAAGVDGRVVGEGPALASARSLATQLGASVDFVGGLDRADVRRQLERSAVVALLPRADEDGSGAEGLGLTLLEGAAAGAMPVGCSTGGVPEAVGPSGVVVDPDDPPAAAIVVKEALERWDPEGARRWLAEHHGTDRIAAALLS